MSSSESYSLNSRLLAFEIASQCVYRMSKTRCELGLFFEGVFVRSVS